MTKHIPLKRKKKNLYIVRSHRVLLSILMGSTSTWDFLRDKVNSTSEISTRI